MDPHRPRVVSRTQELREPPGFSAESVTGEAAVPGAGPGSHPGHPHRKNRACPGGRSPFLRAGPPPGREPDRGGRLSRIYSIVVEVVASGSLDAEEPGAGRIARSMVTLMSMVPSGAVRANVSVLVSPARSRVSD